MLVWESFSEGWATDVAKQLKLNPTILKAEYGTIPDLAAIDWTNDVIFVANGTTSGVKIPHWEWIPDTREGLTLCDATMLSLPCPWTGRNRLLPIHGRNAWGKRSGARRLILSPVRGAD